MMDLEDVRINMLLDEALAEIERLRSALFRMYEETGYCAVTDTHNPDLYIEWGFMDPVEDEDE